MAVCPKYKIDSNDTGLRYAEEVCLKQLPTLAADGFDPTWIALEPNSYSDFGGQVNTVARNPINPSRSRKKGVVVDLEASGGFQQDLTFFNTSKLLQGFMFASFREKHSTAPVNGDQYAISDVDGAAKEFTIATPGGTGFVAGQLVVAEGFGNVANNGVKTIASATATTAVVVEALVDEGAPPAGASLSVVGYQATAGVLSIALNGNLVRLVSTAGPDFTTFGLIPGEWIFVGGDGATFQFTNNQGFARISAITAGYLEFDKVEWEPQVEAGGAKTVRLYLGKVLRNESDPNLIVKRSYQLERTLGQDANGTMSEYLVGAVASELTLNVPQAEKVTVDLAFMACEHQVRNGLTGVKTGTRVGVVEGNAFNSSNDFARIKLSLVSETDASTVPLFNFATDLTVTINNNISANKAIGVLGAFDMSAGTFEVGGSLTAYFATAESAQAIRSNADVTIDAIMVKDNQGILYDMPLVSLGNGRLNVEQDQAITIPLDTNAAESKFGHTLLWQFFPLLPNLAAAA